MIKTTSRPEQITDFLEEELTQKLESYQQEHSSDIQSRLDDFELRMEQNLERKFEIYEHMG